MIVGSGAQERSVDRNLGVSSSQYRLKAWTSLRFFKNIGNKNNGRNYCSFCSV